MSNWQKKFKNAHVFNFLCSFGAKYKITYTVSWTFICHCKINTYWIFFFVVELLYIEYVYVYKLSYLDAFRKKIANILDIGGGNYI